MTRDKGREKDPSPVTDDELGVGEAADADVAHTVFPPAGGLVSPEGILLVEQIGGSGSSGHSETGRQTPLASVVSNALRELLGQLPSRSADPSATLDLLNRSIVQRGEGEYQHFEVAPYRAVALPDSGEVSGPQQQLQRWTEDFEQRSLALLDGLRPVGPKIDPETGGQPTELEFSTLEPSEAEAVLGLLRSVLRQLTEELKRPTGPIQERVRNLFGVILVDDFHGVSRADRDDRIFESELGSESLALEGTGPLGGLVGHVRRSFGLLPRFANTSDDERVLLDFEAFLEHLGHLRQAWRVYLRKKSAYLSTWTTELSRSLLVINEALDSLETELDTAGIGPATRQSIQLTATDGDEIPLQDYLSLLRTAVTSDIPDMLDQSGRRSLPVIASTLAWVRSLVGDEWFFDNPVTNRWRVRSAWQDLIRALDEALETIGVGDEDQAAHKTLR